MLLWGDFLLMVRLVVIVEEGLMLRGFGVQWDVWAVWFPVGLCHNPP